MVSFMVLAQRHMQFVDFPVALGMLDFPHPLFAHDHRFQTARRHPLHLII